VVRRLRERFPAVVGPDTDDICYATQNRQRAVRELARHVDLVLVIGSRNSSNSNRLREIAAEAGVASHLIDRAGELDPAWLDGVGTVGVTAGASAPEALVEDLVDTLRRSAPVEVSLLPGIVEDVKFRLPSELLDA
jgi:4-hydroxy-3-methylbut-2-enyl diphosphate reductase